MRLILPTLALPLALLTACSNPPEAAMPQTAAEPTPQAAPAVAVDTSVLSGYHWQLQQANDASGAQIPALLRADKPVTLAFNDGRLLVTNTCNRMSGAYSIAADKLLLSQLASTMMACHDQSLDALDKALAQTLKGQMEIVAASPEQLALAAADGTVLVFKGIPTAQTRFGGEGETVFLEVAADTKPCPHPLIPDKRCLQVRERQYNENGTKRGTPGAFENFYDSIEGYTHEAGVRNVLRVKKYHVANPPADASSNAWVLDLVVESATEK